MEGKMAIARLRIALVRENEETALVQQLLAEKQ
jgi:hypothetical protein